VDIKDLQQYLIDEKAISNTIIIASHSQDPSGMIYLTPFTAMAVAEYFCDQGLDTLVILDDLTTHAKFYREISLIAKKFPGRESYPGDIFYLHSRLLERAGNFAVADGEASITCLPVAESLEGDITGYIQTNIMSMVDGHIFFDSDLFTKGRRPAINPFISVTRVGNQTQSQVRRDIHREIITVLNLFEKAETFAHFSNTLIESTKMSLATGEKILAFLSQESTTTIPSNVQAIFFAMIWLHFWNEGEIEKIKTSFKKVVDQYISNKKVSKVIDEMINQSSSFNDLLARVDSNRNNLKKII
jgi:F-type H+-transporting ATPase subunit alpha